jgi:NAD-dependent dihydropyrimidine dehydrogenase PreA subunit
MIALIVADRCTACGACVAACPTNVLDLAPAGPPVLARVEDCQTCFMCELYCRTDAIYVDPDADRRVFVSEDGLSPLAASASSAPIRAGTSGPAPTPTRCGAWSSCSAARPRLRRQGPRRRDA